MRSKNVSCPHCRKVLKIRKDGKLPVHHEKPPAFGQTYTCLLSECTP